LTILKEGLCWNLLPGRIGEYSATVCHCPGKQNHGGYVKLAGLLYVAFGQQRPKSAGIRLTGTVEGEILQGNVTEPVETVKGRQRNAGAGNANDRTEWELEQRGLLHETP